MKMFLRISLFGLVMSLLLISCKNNTAKEDVKKSIDIAKNYNPSSENSIYQLKANWQNQFSDTVQLADLKGKIQLTAMIFTSCGYACPKMVHNMKMVQENLPTDLKNKVDFLLFTFDTKKDTPERLLSYAKERELGDHWTLLHGKQENVRTVSMLLDTKYNRLNNGMYSHSNIMSIIDKNGNIYGQFTGLDIQPEPVIKAIEKLVALK